MAGLEEVILYVFQQCVYYISKVSPQHLQGERCVLRLSERVFRGTRKECLLFPPVVGKCLEPKHSEL